MFRADLHTHTTCSDGSLTPQELIAKAKEMGLQGISITDHDTVDAYADLDPKGLLIGTGVEFSCIHNKMSIHILGYDVDWKNPALQKLCHKHKERREKRNRAILEKLTLLGISITEEELYKEAPGKIIGRPHIANLMLKKGYIIDFQEAFTKYLAEKKPAYVPGEAITIEETIAVIKEAKGKAFIAHPHLADSKRKILNLLPLGFDGIEVYYGRMTLDQNTVWLNVAYEKGLLISGGSDFHGAAKPHIPLGASWVDEAVFHSIFKKPLGLNA